MRAYVGTCYVGVYICAGTALRLRVGINIQGQRWSPRGRGLEAPRGQLIASLALASSIKSLALASNLKSLALEIK
jgi:hypothetical protein